MISKIEVINMDKYQEKRMKKIINLANKLGWVSPPAKNQSYPVMMISEVEKCMIAMTNDNELERIEDWAKRLL